MCHKIKKIKFEILRNCLEVTRLDNKVNCLEKNEINLDCLKKDHREFIKK